MNTSLLHHKRFLLLNTYFEKRIQLLLFLIFISSSNANSQELISQTEIRRFARNEYEAGTQNWQIVQGKNKRLYIANNEGLLVYNGSRWQLYPVPNKTIVRSVGFGAKERLYVGAQDEIGYFSPDKLGRLCFHSLKQLLPQEGRVFTDVWQLETRQQEVFFRTDAKIFKFDGKEFSVYPTKSKWISLHKHQEQILAHDRERGLLIYQNQEWKTFISKKALPPNFLISDLVVYEEGCSLLSTVNNGLFLLKKNKLEPFPIKTTDSFTAKQHFTALALMNDGSFLLGTYFNGIYRVAANGEILENISTKNGLSNNTVRCLFRDNYDDIWVGLDNGLAFFTYNNAVRHINPPIFNNGIGYDVEVQNNNLYFALSTGLMHLPLKAVTNLEHLQQNPEILLDGLTWNLSLIDKQLLAGRDDGLFAIQNKQIQALDESTGYWICSPAKERDKSLVIAGNYLGVQFFEIDNKQLKNIESLEKFKESSRYLEIEASNIWISHPYRGIYKVGISDKSLRLFSQKDGLPSNLNNHVFKIKGRIVFATTQGIYEYDEIADTILKSKAYTNIFGNKSIRYLKEDSERNIWFVEGKRLGVVDFSTNKPIIHYIPELKNRIVSGFENIFAYNQSNILIGSEPGFYHLNYKEYLRNLREFSVYISEVQTSGAVDSVLFGGYGENKDGIRIPYTLNSLIFRYTAYVNGQAKGLEYSYKLEGFDKDWSNWSKHPEKEYTNLPQGNYSFKVKARKSPSQESAIYEFGFSISPPWYQTKWAYGLYALAFGAFLFALMKYQAQRQKKKQEVKRLADLRKFEEEQQQLAYQHQLELAESEKETIRLRNEKLDAEIKHKNAELASATMNLVQKKELILKLKKELQQLQKNTKVGDDSKELKQLLRALSEEQKLDEEWNNFFQHFNSVHGDFLNILRKKFPDLSPHYLRLCAYLRMNLSSKEIAPLMGISLRGVEINRYRLRKKLDLPTEANLVEYLLNMEADKNE